MFKEMIFYALCVAIVAGVLLALAFLGVVSSDFFILLMFGIFLYVFFKEIEEYENFIHKKRKRK